jgi:hypothetical protein
MGMALPENLKLFPMPVGAQAALRWPTGSPSQEISEAGS